MSVLRFYHWTFQPEKPGNPSYIQKRPGLAFQKSSFIISQCINSILDRTDLDSFLLFFFPFNFVGFLLCVFSSVCDGVLSSLWVASSAMGSDDVKDSGWVSG